MKLIDILVSELPNLGGWPDGVIKMSQDYDGEVWCWRGHGYGNVNSFARISEIADNHRKQSQDEELSCFVTREQYEAALAASKPEWDGEGLPPVGCCIEANYGGVWVKATVAYTEPPEKYSAVDTWKEALVFDCNTTRPFWTDEFRPIRSEADKKRENLAKALHIAAGAAPIEVAGIGPLYLELADKILAGEVAGIRID